METEMPAGPYLPISPLPTAMAGPTPKRAKKDGGDAIKKAMLKKEPGRTQKNPFAFRIPNRVQVVGKSGSGKTFWLINYLCTLGLKQFDQIIWVAPPDSLRQPKLQVLAKKWSPYVTFVEGIDSAKIEELLDHGMEQEDEWETAIVIDDCLADAKNEYLQHLFVAARHRRGTPIELLQAIFPPGARTHRLQTGYFVLFDFAAQDEARRLFQQICLKKGDVDKLTEAYRRVTSKPNGCLIIDLTSPRSEGLRVRDTEMNCIIKELAHM